MPAYLLRERERGPSRSRKLTQRAEQLTHLALVVLLEPLAQANEAALLQRRQVTQVTSDVVGVQLVCGATKKKR